MISNKKKKEVNVTIKDMLINNMIVNSFDEILDINWDPILDNSVVQAEVRLKNGTTRKFIISH